MPEVKAIDSFFDRKGGIARNAGSEFFCDDERAKQLAAYGMVEIIGAPKDEPAEEPAPKPKRSRKKAE